MTEQTVAKDRARLISDRAAAFLSLALVALALIAASTAQPDGPYMGSLNAVGTFAVLAVIFL